MAQKKNEQGQKKPQGKAAQNKGSAAGKRQGQSATTARSAPSEAAAKAKTAVRNKPAGTDARVSSAASGTGGSQKSKSSGAVNARSQRSERTPQASAPAKKKPAGKSAGNSKSARVPKYSQGRTASGKVPRGRTLTTRDKYLDKKARDPDKERPVVVIEANEENELAVVQLSTTEGKDRTRLPKYQQGQSLFKHYVEIEDSDGEPIKVNEKFKENHANMDVSIQDVETITDTVLNHSKPMQKNRQNINKFRGKKE